MALHVDYYASLNSPWTHLGAARIEAITRQPGFSEFFLPRGRAPDVGELVTFPGAEKTLRLIGETKGWLGQSVYLREICGREEGAPPPVDLAIERRNGDFVRSLIVSGIAVPTAARTEPTAPSASSSLWPNHSIPFVKSSAPARMTTNAKASRTRSISGGRSEADHDAQGQHEEDRQRDRGHPALAIGHISYEGADDTECRARHEHHQPQRERPLRPECDEGTGDRARIEGRNTALRSPDRLIKDNTSIAEAVLSQVFRVA